MDPGRWQRIQELMDTVREQPIEDQSEWLARACPEDPNLRKEVESLLAQLKDNHFPERPAFDIHADDVVGHRIGPYRILRLLGQGGMGAVYLAEREQDFEQRVAIKRIHQGLDSRELLQRFYAERQIQARLEHPNIARLLDGGSTSDGSPYLVMEYVEGVPLLDYCKTWKLSLRSRLQLFLQICSAVQLSHQNLVIHRDLKPGNILVTPSGQPKLLDFGIAKLLNPRLSSTDPEKPLGRRPMTLKYASPEQIRGDTLTTASDIYSLGVLLCNLVTDSFPYRGSLDSFRKVRRAICEEEPEAPSVTLRRRASEVEARSARELHQRARQLAGDLDQIVLKSLHKDPSKRYESAEGLASDITRHLDNYPIRARQPTWSYVTSKLLRRNRPTVALILLLLALGLTTTTLWRQAIRETERAQRQEQLIREERERTGKVVDFLRALFQSTNPDEAKGENLDAVGMMEKGRQKIFDNLHDDPALQAEIAGELGTIYRNLGLYEESLELMDHALAFEIEANSEDYEAQASRLHNLASLLYETGRYGESEERFREALEFRKRLGQTGLATVRSKKGLANVLALRGELQEAEGLYREVLALRIKRYGPDHPNVASSHHSLGHLHYLGGEFKAAEGSFRRALEIWRDHFGHKKTEVALASDRLGRVLDALGNHEEAEALFLEALTIQVHRLGDRHLETARTKRDFAALLLEQGEPIVAGILLSQALETLREVKPTGDWEIADAEGLLGAFLTATGRYQEAESCALESYTTLRQTLGESTLPTIQARERLQRLYQAWGRLEQAAKYGNPLKEGAGATL